MAIATKDKTEYIRIQEHIKKLFVHIKEKPEGLQVIAKESFKSLEE